MATRTPTENPADPTAAFEQHRPALTGLAYRMLGSVSEAEDAVQDAFLRWQRSAPADVASPGAYLRTVVTRLCLDRLGEARREREIYPGEWLPEPLLADADDAEHHAEIAQRASLALMLALERLTPLERAAFLLHDVFDADFAEVGAVLGRSEAACRKLASRARARVRDAAPRHTAPRHTLAPDRSSLIADAFFAAARSGDEAALRELLREDAVLHSDGGGRAPAAMRPVLGADRVTRFYAGLARRRSGALPTWSRRVTINGMPGIATLEPEGTLQTTALELDGERIAAVYVTRNPDKLRHVARLLPDEARLR